VACSGSERVHLPTPESFCAAVRAFYSPEIYAGGRSGQHARLQALRQSLWWGRSPLVCPVTMGVLGVLSVGVAVNAGILIAGG